jgi:hypothetical protein
MLGLRDRRHLAGAHPDLRRVVERAAREGAVPFLIGDPASRSGEPRYRAGFALDLYPLLGRPVTALRRTDFTHLVAAVRSAARVEGVPMVFGCDHRGGAGGAGEPSRCELDPSAYPP